MTKEEEQVFHDRLWNDKKFSDEIYQEYEVWVTEEDDFCEEDELELEEFTKKTSRRIGGKYKARGKFVHKDL